MKETEEISIAEEKVVDISLKDLAKKLEEFTKARDWEKYHSPRNLLLAMVMSYPPYICVQSILLGYSSDQTHIIYVVWQLAYSTELLVCINYSKKQYKTKRRRKLFSTQLYTQALSTALSSLLFVLFVFLHTNNTHTRIYTYTC